MVENDHFESSLQIKMAALSARAAPETVKVFTGVPRSSCGTSYWAEGPGVEPGGLLVPGREAFTGATGECADVAWSVVSSELTHSVVSRDNGGPEGMEPDGIIEVRPASAALLWNDHLVLTDWSFVDLETSKISDSSKNWLNYMSLFWMFLLMKLISSQLKW